MIPSSTPIVVMSNCEKKARLYTMMSATRATAGMVNTNIIAGLEAGVVPLTMDELCIT